MADTSLAMLPWFPRDFLASTRAMRLAERGAYRELLDYQWEMGVLPAEHERLARLLGVDAAEFDDLWPAISHKFEEVPGGLQNQRLEQHRKKALEQRDKKRRGAAIANAKRGAERSGERGAERPGQRSAERPAKRLASASPPSPSPSVEEKTTSSPTARSATGTRLPDDFALTEARRAIAVAERLDPERTFAKFTDHWRSASGSRSRKLDWDATWRNWCRNETDRNGASNGTHRERREPRISALERVRRANADALDDPGDGPPRVKGVAGHG